MKKALLIILFLAPVIIFAGVSKPKHLQKLEDDLFVLNNNEQYDSSFQLINSVIEDDNSSNLDLCFAYIYLSHLNKRLFSYSKTYTSLKKALEYAENCKQKDFAITNVKAELALCYFDQDIRKEANDLIRDILPESNKYLDATTHAYLLLVVGSIQLEDNNEVESAKNFFIQSAKLLQNESPCHLPLAQMKLIHVYSVLNELNKLEEVKTQLDRNIDSCKIFKYKILAARELKKSALIRNDYESYVKYDLITDTLSFMFNSQDKAIDLENTINTYKLEINEAKLKLVKEREKFYGILLGLSLVFLLIISIILVKVRGNKEN